MSQILISSENLNVGYENKIVVSNVNISAAKGEMFTLLGSNGCGKSTIIKTLAGILKPVSGNVYIKGRRMEGMNKKEISKCLALVLTERISVGIMTGWEVVAMGRVPYTGLFSKLTDKDTFIIERSLRLVNAIDLKDRYYNEMSDGQKQKIMIARALAQEPEILLLDEPTSHLDIRHRIEVLDILSTLCRDEGIVVILSLHDISMAMKTGQKIVLVHGGRIVDIGLAEEVIDGNVINELYEIKNAYFDDRIGNVEFQSKRGSDIFLLGGGGSAIGIARLLNKGGYGFDIGVLHEFDIDVKISGLLANKTVIEDNLDEISKENFDEAKNLIDSNSVVIDSGFKVGRINGKNMELIKYAISKGKRVYSLREEAEGVIYCRTIEELFERLKEGIYED